MLLLVSLAGFPADPVFGNQPVAPGREAQLAHLDTLWLGGEKEAALEETVPLIEAARAGQDSTFLLELLARRGSYLVYYSDPVPAETVLREALRLAEEGDDPRQVCRVLRWLSHTVTGRDRSEERTEIVGRLLSLAREIGDRGFEGWALVKQGYTAMQEGSTHKAIDLYDQSVACFNDADDREGVVWAYLGLGNGYDNLGDYERAMSVYRETAQLARHPKTLMVEPMALNNIARLEYITGRFEPAMEHFEEAHQRQVELGTRDRAVIPSVNVARCLVMMGRGEEALARLEKELDFCVGEGYSDMEAMVRSNTAEFLFWLKRYNEAIILCRQALESDAEMSITDRIEYGITLADALAGTGDREAALVVLENNLRLNEKRGEYIHRVHIRRKIGIQALELGRFDEALKHERFVLEESRRRSMQPYISETLYNMSRCYYGLHQRDSCITYLERAAAYWEEIRKIPLDPRWRERRGEAGRQIFTELAARYLEFADEMADKAAPAAAFDCLQAFKARTLLERMVGPGGETRLSEPEEQVAPVTLARIQEEILREGELLLDFYVGYDESLLFVVTKDSAVVELLPAESDFVPKLWSYYELLSSPALTPQSVLEEIGTGLLELFPERLSDQLAGIDRVIVAGDGPWNLLPLVELPFELSADCEWIRVPSATILARLRDDRAAPGMVTGSRMLAIAGASKNGEQPLEGAISEVRSLARRYENVDSIVLIESDSTRSLPDWGDYDLLHLATHVRADDPSPWQSEILFRPHGDPSNPRALQIAALDLRARLVVLSSCNTASGTLVSGEGFLGLTSAFISAGVPAVLATAWAVEDGASARLVKRFYSALASGQNAAAALRIAQRQLREDPETSHPFYWAGFMLVGDGDVCPALQTRRQFPFPLGVATAIVGLLALLVLGAILRKRA